MPRKSKKYCSSSSSSSHAELVGFRYVGAKIRVTKAENLGGSKFSSRINKIDPYLVMGFGDMSNVIKGKTHKKAGQNLSFNEVFHLKLDQKSRYIKVVAMDHDTFSRDDILGMAKLDCQELHDKSGKHKIAFFCKGKPAGSIDMEIEFSTDNVVSKVTPIETEKPIEHSSSSSSKPPADMMIDFMGVEVVVKSGENLGGSDAPSKMNPFLVLRLSGETYKGRVHKRCKPDMKFGECFRMPYDGKSRSVKLCVIDRDRNGDDVLGVGKIDIPAIIKHTGDHEIPLFGRQGTAAGHLNVRVDFVAEKVPASVVFGSSSCSH